MMEGWTAKPWRYGLDSYIREEDGATVSATMTAGGGARWEAWHPCRGLAASDRGIPKRFTSPNAARKWIEARDA